MTLLAGSRGKANGSRLLTVSNRGPVEFHQEDDGRVVAVPGQGGLATALQVTAKLRPTTWLSSPLSQTDRQIAEGELDPPADCNNRSRFVSISTEVYELFYGCFSNEVLWFLQHAMPWPDDVCHERLEEAWDDGYVAANRTFAEAVVAQIDSGDVSAVMFHDYHFYLAPLFVRQARPRAFLQHFVHIPWPGPDEWRRLDDAVVASLCKGLLGNDSVVFQTQASVANFIATCEAYLPEANIGRNDRIRIDGREVRVWANAISIDTDELAEVAATQEFSRHRWLLRNGPGRKTIVRVDRLDPTKNVVRGFEAYRKLLREHPELHGNVDFLALLVPSRSDIESYRQYQAQTHALTEAINREFGSFQWKPVRVFFEHNRVQALAAMSLYDVLLVNPLADGMNLVAKEGPMLNTHGGVLVLSKRAGAYDELAEGAIGIEPEDVDATAAALYEALTMPAADRFRRSRLLRDAIKRHSLRDWFTALLRDIEERSPAVAVTAA
jgi:trehalose 6-phosphate synthase